MIGAVLLLICGFAVARASAPFQLSAEGTTVYDITNNISWLADADLAASKRFGLPVCDGAVDTKTCINASGLMSYQAVPASVAAMNAANYLGHSNWQLPTTPVSDHICSLGETSPKVMESTGPDNVTPLAGSGQLSSTGSVGGFGIFSNPNVHWNAVVPLETHNASKHIPAFDNTGPPTTGLAIANLAALQQNIQVIIRDDAGAQIGVPQSLTLAPHRHKQFLLPELLPAVTGQRGMVEFTAPQGQSYSIIGLRARSSDGTLTTIPVFTN